MFGTEEWIHNRNTDVRDRVLKWSAKAAHILI